MHKHQGSKTKATTRTSSTASSARTAGTANGHVFGTACDYSNIPTRARFKYVNGRPAGSGATPDMAAWTTKISRITSLQSMHELFAYDLLERVAPWVQTVRAGIVLICDTTMLIVYERPMQYLAVRGGRERIVSVDIRAGFPKGAREPADRTAFDTAHRELLEETGVDILDPATDASLSPMTFVFPRSETGELFVWFIAVVPTRPAVKLQNSELDKYEWVAASCLSTLKLMTNPTQLLVGALSRVDLTQPAELISLAGRRADPAP